MKSAIHKIIHYCLLLIVISFPAIANTHTKQATPQTKQNNLALQVGQTVAENDYLYRKIIAITPQNFYQVQNFYKKTQDKQSDVFIIKDAKNLSYFQELYIYDLNNLIFEGPLTLWSSDGHKSMSFTVSNGNADGLFTKYYDDGDVEIEGYYHAGKPDGLWKFWSTKGDIEKQVYFKAGITQWQKESFDLKGI